MHLKTFTIKMCQITHTGQLHRLHVYTCSLYSTFQCPWS